MTILEELEALPPLLVEGFAGMTGWGYLNTILSLIAIIITVWKLWCYSSKALLGERIGTALIAAGLTLIIAQIVANSGKAWVTRTPFDGCSTSIFRVGLILHFGTRIFVHRYANWQQVQIAKAGLRQRGKA